MTRLFQRQPAVMFAGIACFISWMIWTPLVLNAQFQTKLPELPAHHYWGALGPILAAFLTSFALGAESWASFRSRLFRFRVKWIWYIAAAGLPVAVAGLAAVILAVKGKGLPDPGDLFLSNEFPAVGIAGAIAFQIFTFGLGEEAGWRGFLLPRLQSRWSAAKATLVLTAVWAVWHIPAFFYRPGYASMNAAMIIGWVASLLTGSVYLTWIFNSTRGSVPAAAVFHGIIDVVFTSRAFLDPDLPTATGMILMLFAALILVFAGTTDLSHVVRTRDNVDEGTDPGRMAV